jgi:hypothetical protein
VLLDDETLNLLVEYISQQNIGGKSAYFLVSNNGFLRPKQRLYDRSFERVMPRAFAIFDIAFCD